MQNQTKYLFILISQINRYPSEGAAQSRTLTASLLNGRGYTAHEMLPTFALINMNGRLYDPVLGRMLSPDNYIQLPDFTQNFNRYSYVLNNPLKYTDPSGEIVWFAPVIIGAMVGSFVGGIRADRNNVNFQEGMLKGAIVGAISGAFALVGGGTFIANVAWGAVEGGTIGGIDAALWDQDVGKGIVYGAAIGATFAAGSSLWNSYNNYQDYGYFGTDEGIFNRLKGNVQNKYLNGNLSGVNNAMNDLNTYASRKYGFFPNFEFSVYRSTTTLDGRACVGFFDNKAGIGGSSLVKRSGAAIRRSMMHETQHINNILTSSIINTIDTKSSPMISTSTEKWFYRGDNLTILGNNHGTVGYYEPIQNAGRLHIGAYITESTRPGTQIAWQQYGWKKWFYLFPKRF